MTVSFNFVPVSITGVTLTGGNWSSSRPRLRDLRQSRFVTTLTLQDLVVTGCTGSSAIDSWVPLDMSDSTVRDNESSGIALSYDPNGGSKTSADPGHHDLRQSRHRDLLGPDRAVQAARVQLC